MNANMTMGAFERMEIANAGVGAVLCAQSMQRPGDVLDFRDECIYLQNCLASACAFYGFFLLL